MKRIIASLFFFLSVLCALPLLVGCGSDGSDAPEEDENVVPGGGEDAGRVDRELTVYVYPGVTEADGVVPRMTVVDGCEMCTELYDPTDPGVMVFHYMNSRERVSAFMSASSKGITILEDDPFSPVPEPVATLITADGADIVISTGTYSKQQDSYAITSSQRVANAMTRGGMQAVTRGDDMDFVRELVMKDIIRPMSSALSDANSVISVLPFSKGASAVLTIWSDFGLVAAEAHLYSNDEKEFAQKYNEIMVSNLKKKIKATVEVLENAIPPIYMYRASLAAYKYVRDYDYEKYDDVSDDFVMTTTNSYSFTSRRAQTSSWEVYDESAKYKPAVRLVSVGDRSATVCGSFSGFDGRFTVTGYRLYRNRVMVENVSATLDGSTTYTFGNLQKGETYQVTATATVMGTTYESPYVEFRIDGDLELSESSLTFSESGGKKTVQVTLPADDWTWTARSSAGWCRVTPGRDNTLQIAVSAGSESREATVTVEAKSPRGDSQAKTISVAQQAIGNMAYFRGTCKLVSKTEYPSKPSYNFTQEQNVDLTLFLMRMGGTTTITSTLPLSGVSFANWALSSTSTSGVILSDGFSLTRFTCSWTDTFIRIDGSSKGPDNSTGDFSLAIDLSALSVKVLESRKSSGTAYPGGGATQYKSQETLSGTLSYTGEYVQ